MIISVDYACVSVQANSASGMHVSDECKLKFLELKAKRTYRFIVFKIDEKAQQVTIDKVGNPEETYDSFTECMPENECRYAVYDFDFTTPENCQKSKIFFIAWYNLLLSPFLIIIKWTSSYIILRRRHASGHLRTNLSENPRNSRVL